MPVPGSLDTGERFLGCQRAPRARIGKCRGHDRLHGWRHYSTSPGQIARYDGRSDKSATKRAG